ncbi:oligosaccharide flippase family protein [Phycisphaerales bacterium AB-hyl4]|uniref:Oligosaccharide flippase family protein n=1 Tax=Natronomicrosphaera hydrolytica TaxID=3242702 RepID=A0ABV4U708_9BACT
MDASNPPHPGGAIPAPTPGLKARALIGGGWVTAEYALGQVLRFGGNLVLAYLLVPEAFGLMALVNVFLQGLQMFSDVGLAPSIIRSKRGEDPTFLNTAWTIQIIRGFVLWAAALALAVPVSWLWGYELRYLLPVAGITAITMGLGSTSIYVLNRQLKMQALAKLRLAAQAVGVVVMVAWALVHPSVWAMIAGAIASQLVRCVGSYALPTATRHRLAFDRAAFTELFRFGRWIFLGTLIAFLAKQIDKLLLGALFAPAVLGVFWIAVQISEVAPLLATRLGQSVGFPALAELYRRDADRFFSRLRHVRAMLIFPAVVGQLLLLVVGPAVAVWLYPPAYSDVGWILRLMIVATLAKLVTQTYMHAFLALGDSFRHMLFVATRLVLTVAAALLGYYYADPLGMPAEVGFIVGLAIAPWLHYPIVACLAIGKRCWQPAVDLPVLTVCAALSIIMLLHDFALI